jgi:hypothetical protein
LRRRTTFSSSSMPNAECYQWATKPKRVGNALPRTTYTDALFVQILGTVENSAELLACLEFLRAVKFRFVCTASSPSCYTTDLLPSSFSLSSEIRFSQQMTEDFPAIRFDGGVLAGLLLVPLAPNGSDFIVSALLTVVSNSSLIFSIRQVFFRKGLLQQVHYISPSLPVQH